jgi:hypothetical protein
MVYVFNILDELVSEQWHDYVAHSLSETRERDRQTLGGTRPDASYTNAATPISSGDGEFSAGGGTNNFERPIYDEKSFDLEDHSYNNQVLLF